MSARTRPSLCLPELVLDSLLPLTVDHPRNSKSVYQHTECGRPEGRLKGHLHGAAVRQSVKDALRFPRVGKADAHREAFCRSLAVLRWGVGAHQFVAAHGEADVHDFLAPLRRHLV